MLKRTVIAIVIGLVCAYSLLSTDLYGQVPTPTKSSNKPEYQTESSQQSPAVIGTIAPQPVPQVPLSLPPDAKIKTTNEAQNKNDKAPSGWWLIGFNGFLVIIVFMQWLLMRRQTRWMQKSAEVANESLISTQRAFLSLKDISVTKILDTTGKVIAWRFIANLENSGSTPAINLWTQVNRKINDSPPLSHEYIKGVQQGNLGAHNITRIGPLNILINELIPVYDRKKHLYIFGMITYNDILPKTPPHIEKFCQEILIIGGHPSDPTPGTDIAFTSHSTYDDQNHN